MRTARCTRARPWGSIVRRRCSNARQTLDVDGLTFELGDIATFAPAEPFDVIISNAALQWIPDHATVLARWAAALTEHGQLAVQMPTNADHASHRLSSEVAREQPFLDAFDGAPPPDPVLDVAKPEEYSELLDAIGFAEQHVRLQVYPHHLASTADVVEWVKGTSLTRFKERMSPELFDQFVDRYRERLVRSSAIGARTSTRSSASCLWGSAVGRPVRSGAAAPARAPRTGRRATAPAGRRCRARARCRRDPGCRASA